MGVKNRWGRSGGTYAVEDHQGGLVESCVELCFARSGKEKLAQHVYQRGGYHQASAMMVKRSL